MNFHIVTLFPELIEQMSSLGVVGQALKKAKINVEVHNPRQFASDVHQSVDDRPFGGGDGMVMMAEPLAKCFKGFESLGSKKKIYLSPQGIQLTQSLAQQLAQEENLILLCGRYGGVDQRFLDKHIDLEVSIGDYVLAGGELPGLVLMETVARFVPGVLGNAESPYQESFSSGLLEAPQYTRPRIWENMEVPEQLVSGNHQKIQFWKELMSAQVTRDKRPDLLSRFWENPVHKTSFMKTLKQIKDHDLKDLAIDQAFIHELINELEQPKP